MSEQDLEHKDSESLSNDLGEMIADRAYELFQARGGAHGYALDDWLQAEREVRGAQVGTETAQATTEPQLAATAAATTGVATDQLKADEPRARSGTKK